MRKIFVKIVKKLRKKLCKKIIQKCGKWKKMWIKLCKIFTNTILCRILCSPTLRYLCTTTKYSPILDKMYNNMHAAIVKQTTLSNKQGQEIVIGFMEFASKLFYAVYCVLFSYCTVKDSIHHKTVCIDTNSVKLMIVFCS